MSIEDFEKPNQWLNLYTIIVIRVNFYNAYYSIKISQSSQTSHPAASCGVSRWNLTDRRREEV